MQKLKPEELLRKFGAEEAEVLKERASQGEIEAHLILEAAHMQAQDGSPDLAQLASAFECTAPLVRRVIQEFNRQGARSFRLPRHPAGKWRLSSPSGNTARKQRHFEL